MANRSVTVESGELYEGTLRGGKPHGKGIIRYPDGSRYEGWLKNGAAHGRGRYTYPPSDERLYYEGGFKHGRFHGKGILRTGDSLLEGRYKNGLRHGKFHTACGTHDAVIYYVNDKPSATKKARVETKSTLFVGTLDSEGEMFYGRLTYKKDGTYYVGFFKGGKKHGEGEMHYSNGELYVGEFKNGKYFGSGRYYFKNGDSYTATFFEDGGAFGTYHTVDGTSYEYKYDKFG